MHHRSKTSIILLGLFCVGFIGGCSSSPDGPLRYAISGEVSLDTQPLDSGNIVFVPGQGGATGTGATIEKGKFAVPSERGLAVGTYRVEIMSTRATGKKVPGPGPDGMVDETEQIIPAKYNLKSEIEAKVNAEDENHFTFELSMK